MQSFIWQRTPPASWAMRRAPPNSSHNQIPSLFVDDEAAVLVKGTSGDFKTARDEARLPLVPVIPVKLLSGDIGPVETPLARRLKWAFAAQIVVIGNGGERSHASRAKAALSYHRRAAREKANMLEILFWLFAQSQNPRFAAGLAFYQAGDCAAAMKAFGESGQAREEAPDRSLYEGICLGKQGAWSAAAAHLDPYVSSHSRDERAWYWLARAELHLKNFASSREAILHAIALQGKSPDFYRTLGEIELELKNHQAAYQAWMKAEALDPRDSRTTFYLGRLFFEAAVFDEAAVWFRQTLKLAPRHFRAMTYLGLCSEQLNQSESAIKLYRSAVAESIAQSNPYSWAFVDLAKLLRKTGQESEALDVLRQAEKLCPDGHVLSLLGQMLATSEPDRAEALLRRAITMDPGIADAHYRLAILLRARGKTGEAEIETKRFQAAKESEEHNRVKVTALREGQHN